MTKQEQLDILKSGREEWNNWRAANPNANIDLSGLTIENLNYTNLPKGIYIGDAKNAIKKNFLYKFIPIRVGGLLRDYYDSKYLGKGIDLSGVNFKGSIIRNVDFTGADLSDSVLEKVHIYKSTMIFSDLCYAKLTNSKIENTAMSHSSFYGTNLSQSVFVNSGLEDSDFTGSYITYTTRFSNCKVIGTRIEKSRLETMENYGGLSVGNRMKMRITDHVATLRASYSGFQQWIHLVALIIFSFPYIWFVISLWIKAEFMKINSESFSSITLAEALSRYIFNGGIDWQTGFSFHWTFITFIWMFIYNVIRGILLWKTKTLELQQKISNLPVEFTLPGSMWGGLYKIANWSFVITMMIVILNTFHFMMMRVVIT